jgi:RimJ/RimL family protein N-acetyltransferase
MPSSPSRPELHLETARLVMRPWLAADTSWHRDLVAERGDGKRSPQEDAAVIDGLLARTREHGVVPSVVVLKSTSAAVGYCGLVVGRASISEPELAFELFERVRGNGYATEAATAVVAAAARSGRSRLWATVAPWNAPSFRVLEKLGFRRDRSEWDDKGEFVWNVLDLRRHRL